MLLSSSVIRRLIRHSFCLSSNPCQPSLLHSIPLLPFSIISKSFLFLPFFYCLPLSSSSMQLYCPFIPASPSAISILFLSFPFSDACLPYPAIILFSIPFLPACFVHFRSICYAYFLVSSGSLSLPLSLICSVPSFLPVFPLFYLFILDRSPQGLINYKDTKTKCRSLAFNSVYRMEIQSIM
jgi:hypothetical protein